MDHGGGGIPPSALLFIGIFVVAIGMAIALKMDPKNKNKK
jgi:hypothetical protein